MRLRYSLLISSLSGALAGVASSTLLTEQPDWGHIAAVYVVTTVIGLLAHFVYDLEHGGLL